MALDAQGGVYSIGKRTTGATAKEVRAKLADLDREHIPTVEQARAELPARQQEREQERAQRTAQERPQEAAEPTQGQMVPERESAAQTPLEARETWDTAAAQTTAPERRPEPEHERSGLRVVDRDTGLESSVSAFAGKALDTIANHAEGLIEGMASLFDGGSATTQRRSAPEPPTRAPKSALQRLQERAANYSGQRRTAVLGP